MASVESQGFQIESIVHTPKLSSKPIQFHQKPNPEPISNNVESVNKNNGWDFFNVLENPTSNHVEEEEDAYVHPMVKRSASALSTMSLEMCTESLGTETGSDVSESSDEFNFDEKQRFRSLLRSKSHLEPVIRRRGGGGGFPPPLTSISGSDGTVKVRPHRVGGRLVIKAVSVSVSDCGTKFEAERTNGRLSLSLRDCCVNVETRRAKLKNEDGKKGSCDGDMKISDGGWSEINGADRKTKIRSPERDSIESGLSRCKDDGNGNIVTENWCLLRVVI